MAERAGKVFREKKSKDLRVISIWLFSLFHSEQQKRGRREGPTGGEGYEVLKLQQLHTIEGA